MKLVLKTVLGVFAGFALQACNPETTQKASHPQPASIQATEKTPARAIVSVPQSTDPACRDGQSRIFDECGSQLAHYQTARRLAAEEKKTVLVVYGVDWCIWCHVFDSYIHGVHGEFEHTYSDANDIQHRTVRMSEPESEATARAAEALRAYTAENFVVLNVDAQYAEDGPNVLMATGVDPTFVPGFPFVYAINARGEAIGVLPWDYVEVQREAPDWFLGYNRARLLEALTDMRAAAL